MYTFQNKKFCQFNDPKKQFATFSLKTNHTNKTPHFPHILSITNITKTKKNHTKKMKKMIPTSGITFPPPKLPSPQNLLKKTNPHLHKIS
jgi:hypothetical protein